MGLFSRTSLRLWWSAVLAAGLLENEVMDTKRPLQGRPRLGPSLCGSGGVRLHVKILNAYFENRATWPMGACFRKEKA